jgi:hypothetical protein
MATTLVEPVLGERDLRVGPMPGAPATASQCFLHAHLSPAAVLEVVKAHSREYRAVGALTAWAEEPVTAGDEDDPVDARPYRVIGWTTTSILRGTLSRRLDSLNPVAAFRLLDQPEIAQLERWNRDYVVLVDAEPQRTGGGPAGSISARDIDLWCTSDPAELQGAFALDLDTYCRRFAGTGLAA